MPQRRSQVRTYYRRGTNGPVMVRGHQRGGFAPHPERFKGQKPRSRKADMQPTYKPLAEIFLWLDRVNALVPLMLLAVVVVAVLVVS